MTAPTDWSSEGDCGGREEQTDFMVVEKEEEDQSIACLNVARAVGR